MDRVERLHLYNPFPHPLQPFLIDKIYTSLQRKSIGGWGVTGGSPVGGWVLIESLYPPYGINKIYRQRGVIALKNEGKMRGKLGKLGSPKKLSYLDLGEDCGGGGRKASIENIYQKRLGYLKDLSYIYILLNLEKDNPIYLKDLSTQNLYRIFRYNKK